MATTTNPLPTTTTTTTSTTTPSKTVNSKNVTTCGVSPVSIFANLDQSTPIKKKSPAAEIISKASKEKASLRSKLWSAADDETRGDWSAMHDILKAQLIGKVKLDWAIPEPKVISTGRSCDINMEEEHVTLANKLSAYLKQRDQLLEESKAKLTKASTLDEEKEGLDHEYNVLRSSESNRWSQITKSTGNNSLTFPVQNIKCHFDPTYPNLRNEANYYPCTEDEMKQGEWGIEHKQLEANDANTSTFPLARYTLDDTIELNGKDELSIVSPSKVNPSTDLRSFFNNERMKVMITEEELNQGEWGIEHKKLEPNDVNSNTFPLARYTLDDTIELNGKDELSIVSPNKVSPDELRNDLYDSDTTMYSEEDAASVADLSLNSSIPESKLTEDEINYFNYGWQVSLHLGSSSGSSNSEESTFLDSSKEPVSTASTGKSDTMMDTSIDENRLCQWKYFVKTDIITVDKTTSKQKEIWKLRDEKGKLASKTILNRRRKLAKRFNCALPNETFFQECLKVASPEERDAKLLALQESELTVGWYGSLREDRVYENGLPTNEFDCTLVEGRDAVWRYYTSNDIIATDKTTTKQNALIEARLKRGPLAKNIIQHRIRSLTKHFGVRCEAFWSSVSEKTFHEDVIKVALPENRLTLLKTYQQKDEADSIAREERKKEIILKRQSKIAFYSNTSLVKELLLKKDEYFRQRKHNWKYLDTRKHNPVLPLKLESPFFATWLKTNSTTAAAATTTTSNEDSIFLDENKKSIATTGETKEAKSNYVTVKRNSISF